MNVPAICNGCGNVSPAWDQLCQGCSSEVKCQNCGKVYKRGQGLQEVDLCPSCAQEVFTEDKEEIVPSKSPKPPDSHEEYGFDHTWELYDR